MSSFQQLMDMMRHGSNDGVKRVYSEDSGMGSLLDTDSLISVAGPSSSTGLFASPRAMPIDMSKEERFSRKVFVGGLPPDIDEGNVPLCSLLITLVTFILCRGDHCTFSTFRPVDCRLAAQAGEQILLSTQGLRVLNLHLRTVRARSDR